MRGHACAALLALLALAAPAAPRADEPSSRWSAGEARPFLSAAVDLGSAEHVAVAAGWGRPHDAWGGLIAHGFLTSDDAAVRVGARVDLRALALEAGVRYDRSFTHVALVPQARHRELPDGHGAATRTLDLSASGGLPLGPGFAIYEVLGVRTLSSVGEVHLFDELNRVVYRPPWLGTATAGWVASLRDGALLVGGRAQWAFETGRGGDPFVRAGPILYWRGWPHVALAGALLYPVSDPDRLGFVDPIQAFLVLSFTAATGDPGPRLP